MKIFQGTGSRKSAIARATISPGTGVVRVNSALVQTMTSEMHRSKILEPLNIVGDLSKTVNLNITVKGGGPTAQADAIRLAIAKSFIAFDKTLQKTFLNYDRTLVVADVRQKESHKPNCHGKARAKVQKSYR